MNRACAAMIALSVLLSVPALSVSLPCEVTDDGRQIPFVPDTGSGGLRIGVPLPSTPDWQATLERAVGGLAWGDADGDGDLDLAVGCYYAQSYPPVTDWENLVYYNIGGVLETTPSWVSTDQRSTADVRWADIDGDGRPDLIAANGYSSFDPSVIYFNGPGGLSNSPGWTAGDATWTVGAAAADFDADGDLDVAFANQGVSPDPYRPVSLFRNLGTTLTTMPAWLSLDSCISNSLAWGDVDGMEVVSRVESFTGDGVKRVFHVHSIPMDPPITVTVDGDEYPCFAYEPVAGWISLPFAPAPGTEVEVSYRNSNEPDLAVAKWSAFETGVYFNVGGALQNLTGWTTGNTNSDKGIGWADVDGDGDLDLAVGASSSATALYLNDGTALDSTPIWQSQETYFSCQDLAWGDVDGDGDLDLATVHFGNGHARVYLNQGGALERTASWYYDCSSSATAIAWGDMNGDGRLDLAVGTARQPVMVFLNTTPTDVAESRAPLRPLDLSVYPQPLNPGGIVRFVLPDPGSWTCLTVYDVAGRAVRTLASGRYGAGDHQLVWDGLDDAGRALGPGLYFLRMKTEDQTEVRRVVVLR